MKLIRTDKADGEQCEMTLNASDLKVFKRHIAQALAVSEQEDDGQYLVLRADQLGPRTSVSDDAIRAIGGALGEPGAWDEIKAGLGMSRPVLVARLMELDVAGALTTAHVCAGAQVGGVTARTVWRWLDAARTEGGVERRPRARLELSDQAWVV